jgi:vesicle-associated membrane protein 7
VQYYSESPASDKLRNVQYNLDNVKNLMIDNIDKVLERGEKVEILVAKTEQMSDSAFTLRTRAR